MLDLGKLGKHEGKIPSSIATCLDFVSIWGSGPNRAQLGRLCAAAIAVSVDHKRILPAYPVLSGDPISYGHKILDRLFDAGRDSYHAAKLARRGRHSPRRDAEARGHQRRR